MQKPDVLTTFVRSDYTKHTKQKNKDLTPGFGGYFENRE